MKEIEACACIRAYTALESSNLLLKQKLLGIKFDFFLD